MASYSIYILMTKVSKVRTFWKSDKDSKQQFLTWCDGKEDYRGFLPNATFGSGKNSH